MCGKQGLLMKKIVSVVIMVQSIVEDIFMAGTICTAKRKVSVL